MATITKVLTTMNEIVGKACQDELNQARLATYIQNLPPHSSQDLIIDGLTTKILDKIKENFSLNGIIREYRIIKPSFIPQAEIYTYEVLENVRKATANSFANPTRHSSSHPPAPLYYVQKPKNICLYLFSFFVK